MAPRQVAGVEFHNSTCNALKYFMENGEQSVLTLGYLCLPCCMQNTAWSWDSIKVIIIPDAPDPPEWGSDNNLFLQVLKSKVKVLKITKVPFSVRFNIIIMLW